MAQMMIPGTGYSLPALFEPYGFIATRRFAGKLRGSVVVVTGASGGIGYAIARAFGATGASVVCIARREVLLVKVVEEIRSSGGRAMALVKDVSAKGAALEIVREVESRLGFIDVLVSNAGITRVGPLVEEPDNLDLWWRVFEVNVRAPVALARAVLPSMIARKAGVVITVSSNAVAMNIPCMAAYSASKAAISKFHEGITAELDGTGVTTFALNPGMVRSDLGATEFAFNTDAMQHPTMQMVMQQFQSLGKYQEATLAAQTTIALAVEPRAKILSGHHVNAEQDLEKVIEEAEKEGGGRLGRDRLYRVNIGFL